jgi:hypothetical protein
LVTTNNERLFIKNVILYDTYHSSFISAFGTSFINSVKEA